MQTAGFESKRSSGILSTVSSGRARVMVLVTFCLCLAGCTATPNDSAPPVQSPAASPLLTDIERTKALGTSAIDVTLTVDGALRLSGRGTVDLAKGLGLMTWTDASGTRTELVSERGDYVRTDHWAKVPTSTTRALADPLADLGQLTHLETRLASCGRATCSSYRGTLPASTFPSAVDVDVAVDVHVDVDDRGRISTVTRVAGPVELVVKLHDFGGPLDLTAPSITPSAA